MVSDLEGMGTHSNTDEDVSAVLLQATEGNGSLGE